MTHLAQTASITLITAVPGSGKSLRAVWYAKQAAADGISVYACNINGISIPGVVDFPDPTQWEDLPAGSVLIVDEAQKFFRAGREVPSYIAAMETIRHMGIRLILITQHPTLIHGNIRALVGYHEHLVRENGKTSVTIYTRSRVIDNVRSDKALAAEDKHTWAYPTECYDLYKSAEVHTVKRTVPYKYKRAAILALCALALVGFVVWKIKSNLTPEQQATPAALAASQPPASSASRKHQQPVIQSANDYATAFHPMIPEAPFTAPAYVNRTIAADPEVYCMSSGYMRGKDWIATSCTCLTEQGTRYELDIERCAKLTKRGPLYNPYRSPNREGDRPADEPEKEQGRNDQVVAAAPVSIGEPGQVPAYGSMRNTDHPVYTFEGVR